MVVKKSGKSRKDEQTSIQVNIKPGDGFKKYWSKEIKDECKPHSPCCCHGGGVVYGLGCVGAAIYFISKATGFWMGVLGFLKALVWPVFLIHGLLKFLGL